MNIERKRRDALGRRKRVAEQRKTLLTIFGNKCCKCSFDDSRALNIDHVNGGGTVERERIGGGYYSYLLRKSDEELKRDYQLLCCNCNQIKKIENNEERFQIHCEVEQSGSSSGS